MKQKIVEVEMPKFNISGKELESFFQTVNNLPKTAYENYVNLEQSLTDADNNLKIAKAIKATVCFEKQKKEINIPETVEDIYAKYDRTFLNEILKLFENKYGIHATTTDSAESILKEGLNVNDGMKEITYTVSPALADLTDNSILYSLFNRTHHNRRQIVVVDGTDDDLIPNGKYWVLPNDRIVGYIDIDKQKIVKNQNFKQRPVGKRKQSCDILEYAQAPSKIQSFIIDELNDFKNELNFKTEDDITYANWMIRSLLNRIITTTTHSWQWYEKNDLDLLVDYIERANKLIKQSIPEIKSENNKPSQNPTKAENVGLSMDLTDELF